MLTGSWLKRMLPAVGEVQGPSAHGCPMANDNEEVACEKKNSQHHRSQSWWGQLQILKLTTFKISLESK